MFTSGHTSARCRSAMPASPARLPWRRTVGCIGRRGMLTSGKGKPLRGKEALGTGTIRQTGRLPGTKTPTCGETHSLASEIMRPVSCLWFNVFPNIHVICGVCLRHHRINLYFAIAAPILSSYGSVSAGREFWPLCVLFLVTNWPNMKALFNFELILSCGSWKHFGLILEAMQ